MIGLIFGETRFPKEILKKIKKKRLKYLIIDLTKRRTFKKDRHSHTVSIGQVGKVIRILRESKCKKVLFAGKVEKPNFSKLRLDFKGIYYIARIIKSSKLGDAAILKEIIKILRQEKISTISSITFNPELTLKKGNYSRIKPNKEDKIDIKNAVEKQFDVEVQKVATMNRLGKTKDMTMKSGGRTIRTTGKRSDWKKAIVTLKEGFSIDLMRGEVD